jgi:magnesium transporter
MSAKYRIAAYGADDSVVKEVTKPEDVKEFLGKYAVTWLDCMGAGEKDVEGISGIFNFHKLTQHAYFHSPQRSKLEDYGTYFYLIIKEVEYKKDVKGHKVGIYVGNNYLVTLRENASEALEPIAQMITGKSARVLSAGPDYLCYLIIEEIVDQYMPILDNFEKQIDILENEILGTVSKDTQKKIFKIKRDLLNFRKIVWPMRDLLLKFERSDLPNLTDKTRIYLRDVYDHVITITDIVETYRELTSNVVEAYLTTISNSINQVVKVLTVLAALAVPATIITSFYGMNMVAFPEEALGANEYYFAIALIIIPTVIMLFYFRRKKWI